MGNTIKIAITIFLLFIVLPLYAKAEVIYLKDGTVIKAAKVWEEDGLVRFYLPDYEGITIKYTKDIIERIEKDDGKSAKKEQKAVQKKEAPRKDIKSTKPATSNKKTKPKEGNPTQASPTEEKVPTGVERKDPVVRAEQNPSPASNVGKAPAPVDPKTAAPSDRSPDNMQKAGSQTATAAGVETPDYSQYDRLPEWIKAHLSDTNDLGEIHQNLAGAISAESAKD